MENPESVLKQLKIIKRMVICIAVSAFIMAGSAVYFSVELLSLIEHTLLSVEQSLLAEHADKKSFSDEISDLVDAGKFEDAIKLANGHIKDRPYDSYAYYYRGLSYYHQKQWQLAIEDFNKAEEITPSWKEDYIKSYRSAAQAKLTKH